MTNNITFGVAIKEDVLDLNDVLGGIQIRIGGRRLNQYRNEESFNSPYEWKPDYEGEYIHSDLMRFINIAHSLAAGQLEVDEPLRVEFGGLLSYVEITPISGTEIKVAFQTKSQKGSDHPQPDPESAAGIVVGRCEFCQSVSSAGHSYLNRLQSMPLEWGLGLREEFEDSLNALDETLETCAETPPGTTQQE